MWKNRACEVHFSVIPREIAKLVILVILKSLDSPGISGFISTSDFVKFFHH